MDAYPYKVAITVSSTESRLPSVVAIFGDYDLSKAETKAYTALKGIFKKRGIDLDTTKEWVLEGGGFNLANREQFYFRIHEAEPILFNPTLDELDTDLREIYCL